MIALLRAHKWIPAAFAALALSYLIFPHACHAVPASPTVHTLTQPDGSTFEALQWGDERQHGWETPEGYTILFDQGLRAWVYAVRSTDGSLLSSSILVGKDAPPANLEKELRPARDKGALGPSGEAGAPQLTPLEATGTASFPVILMNFSDTSTSYTPDDLHALFFGPGGASLKDYFNEVSYGKLNLSAGTEGPSGWHKAARTHVYYGRNVTKAGDDAWPGDLVYQAVAQADAAGFDFSQYDRDGDCYVDVAVIIHQGEGEENSGVASDIWAHRWSLSGALAAGRSHYGPYATNSCCIADPSVKVKVNDYITGPESLKGGPGTIGVFAHELGHAIGLPDLYDTDGNSQGIGKWSLMAAGNWNLVTKAGDRPAHPDAWSKYKLGWVTPRRVFGTLTDEPIEQAATAEDVYQLLEGSPMSGEYYLVENRQKAGFDAGLPGAGLLIWHIDGNAVAGRIASNTVNNAQCWPPFDCSLVHYGVGLMQADGQWHLERNVNRGDLRDAYPGPTRNSKLTHEASPSSALWDRSESGVNITAIGASGPTMKANLSVSAQIPIGPFTEYVLPAGDSKPYKITAGADGNLWYTRQGGAGFSQGRIGKITPSGSVTEYPLPAGSWPMGIATGSDGNVWFTNPFYDPVLYQSLHKVGRITPGGGISQWRLPTANGYPQDIAAGPDGRLWASERYGNRLARVAGGGGITEHAVPTAGSEPAGITGGPDGNVWFGELQGNKIGKITPAGAITEYPIPSASAVPYGLTTGPDGNVWFTEYNGGRIGQITPEGVITEYHLNSASTQPYTIKAGPDGNLWFGTYWSIGRITTTGFINEWGLPSSGGAWAAGVAWGPDNSIWFTEYNAQKVAKLTFEAVSTPATPSGPAAGITGTLNTYSTSGSVSNLGHQIQYRFDWDDGTNSGWLPAGVMSTSYAWSYAGTYRVRVQARCATDPAAVSDVPAPFTVTISAPQEGVSIPDTPSGPTQGATGSPYTYSTGGSSSTFDHPVQYLIDWGDGTNSGWLPVGETSASHTWCTAGARQVKVEARCALDQHVVSCWSAGSTVNIAPAPPRLGTLRPVTATSRAGFARTFTAVYIRACGSPSLRTATFLVNGPQAAAHAIRAIYEVPTNLLKLYNDAGTGVVGSCTPGAPGSLANSQGTLSCENTSVSPVGATLTVKWSIKPKKAFASATPKNIYMDVKDVAGRTAGLTDKGDWTINP